MDRLQSDKMIADLNEVITGLRKRYNVLTDLQISQDKSLSEIQGMIEGLQQDIDKVMRVQITQEDLRSVYSDYFMQNLLQTRTTTEVLAHHEKRFSDLA